MLTTRTGSRLSLCAHQTYAPAVHLPAGVFIPAHSLTPRLSSLVPTEFAAVSYATGKWYPAGIVRLRKSLDTWRINRTDYLYTDELPPGSPSHAERPYAFKYFALDHVRKQGHRFAWWLDSSIIMVAPPRLPIRWAIDHGAYIGLFRGYTVGQYTSDAALAELALNRDAAMTMPMADANMFVLDLHSPLANKLLDQMLEWAVHPRVFPGSWNNESHAVATDDRVLGHRHDQSVLSIVAARLGLNFYRYTDLVTRSSLHYRIIEKGSFVCRRGCTPGELRGAVGSMRWRLAQKLAGL